MNVKAVQYTRVHSTQVKMHKAVGQNKKTYNCKSNTKNDWKDTDHKFPDNKVRNFADVDGKKKTEKKKCNKKENYAEDACTDGTEDITPSPRMNLRKKGNKEEKKGKMEGNEKTKNKLKNVDKSQETKQQTSVKKEHEDKASHTVMNLRSGSRMM